MQELRFVAVSEDGRYAVLAVPGRSARFTLPIDERLRAVAQGQTSRLAQYEIEVESPLRPKEIQARIRAGETVEEIADAAGIAVERVRWFEGPVLAERAYMADQAQAASVRRLGDAIPASPGPRLGEIVTERLNAFGADPEEAQWDAKKRGDGSWLVQLTFISGGRLHVAEWVFDPRRRHVVPADDNAARMSLPGNEPPQPAAPPPGEATVTQLAPRLSSASGFGPAGPGSGAFGHGGPGNYSGSGGHSGSGGYGGNGNGGGRAARHERSAGTRPPGPEPMSPVPSTRSVPSEPAASSPEPGVGRHGYQPTPERHVAEPAAAERRVAEPAAPEPRAPERPAAAVPVVSPASVAAQVSRAAQAPRPGRGPGGTPDAAGPVASPSPSPQAEPAGEQPGRSGRKAARGKRSSVPSWDEIMFGSSRQRD